MFVISNIPKIIILFSVWWFFAEKLILIMTRAVEIFLTTRILKARKVKLFI